MTLQDDEFFSGLPYPVRRHEALAEAFHLVWQGCFDFSRDPRVASLGTVSIDAALSVLEECLGCGWYIHSDEDEDTQEEELQRIRDELEELPATSQQNIYDVSSGSGYVLICCPFVDATVKLLNEDPAAKLASYTPEELAIDEIMES